MVIWLLLLAVSVWLISGGGLRAAEPEATNPAARVWKPMADWYRPDLRTPKLIPRAVELSEVRFQSGDDPRWAAPDWDDRGWAVISRTELPLNAGVFWLRLRVRSALPEQAVPSLVMADGLSAWACYWDGIQVAAQGLPGNSKETEVEGMAGKFELPTTLTTPAEHVIAFRVSTYRSAKVGARFAQLNFLTVPADKYRALDSKLNLLPAMGVGAMLTLAIGVFVMWVLADRRLVLALFSALCASAALLIAVAVAPMMMTYPASWGWFQSLARIIMVVLVTSLTLAITILHLCPTVRRGWLAVPLIFQTGLAGFYRDLGINVLTPLLWRVAFGAALVFVAWSIGRRRQGAWLLGLGTASTFALFQRDPKHFEHSDFLFAFLPLLVGLIAAIALRLRAERLQARDTRLTAARLEIELLKKSLQPHFLMNTLTALSQVLEEKPAAAVRLIDDLASEFRSLARFSGEKQVSVGEELALCRAHLGVMSARTDLVWSLQTEGIDVSAPVPPALFLTLIENGFSHQRARKDATAFTLRAERQGADVRYTFLSPGTVEPETARPGGGTGLRYVRARLEESFHGAWKLSQRAVPGGWETVIELRHSAPSGAGA